METFFLIFIPIISLITFHVSFWWLDVTLKNRGLKGEKESQNYLKDFSRLIDLIWNNETIHLNQYRIAFGINIVSFLLFFGFTLYLINIP